jgi:hypothetical protein
VDSQLTDLQRELSANFGQFFERELQRASAQSAGEPVGFDRRLWSAFVRLGGTSPALLGNDSDETDFGAAVELGLQIGRHLAAVPYVEVLTSLRLLEAAAIKTPVGLLDGDAVWVTEAVAATATDVLSSAGAIADGILVLRGNRLSVFDVDQLHATRTPVSNLGQLPMGRVTFGDSGSVAELDLTDHALRSVLADRRLLCSALLVGAGQSALLQTLAHVRQRHQFGRPIGSFQALQHRLADCSTQLSAAELLLRRGGSPRAPSSRPATRPSSAPGKPCRCSAAMASAWSMTCIDFCVT